ncbi:uncharacterized protein LOC132612097 [Lycium barbarum]|uniref:uncharacterized protein LOC132612097 n=1 Tax=Lycium barbarum TaxID=112863 RepID=UPI00293E060F|nr:uncharacterized protein LOC132612097 [Lycium barbarum]
MPEGETIEESREIPPIWTSLFASNRSSKNGMKLTYIPPEIVEGKPVAQLEQEEMDSEIRKWSSALIVYVIGETPGYNYMLRYVTQNWNKVAEPEVFLHEEGYYVVKFQTLADMYEILYSGPYTINNKPMVLKPWTVDFDLSKEFPTEIPLWITMPNLPMSCWSYQSLSRITSTIGKPLFADECTSRQKRISYARVLVEVNFTRLLPDVLE